jgi:hypothetical protein
MSTRSPCFKVFILNKNAQEQKGTILEKFCGTTRYINIRNILEPETLKKVIQNNGKITVSLKFSKMKLILSPVFHYKID